MRWLGFMLISLGGIAMLSCNSVLGADEFKSATCVEGEIQCMGNQPARCTDGVWRAGAACDGQTCRGGACVGECAPSARCAGEQPQSCDNDGQWQVSAPSCVAPYHCNGGACEIDCSAGDLRCAGNKRLACDGKGAWVDQGDCLNQTCMDGQCVGLCGPLDVQCQGDVPLHCDAHGEWESLSACTSATGCVQGSCPGPSCDGLAEQCGPKEDENCCASPVVIGGSYNRNNDSAYPATINSFRMDQFEITVGRFRRFVDAYPGDMPSPGAGAHPLHPMSGWRSEWNAEMPLDRATLVEKLRCVGDPEEPPAWTWTDAPGANEYLPINCLSWHEVFAFCAWDGGWMPTEAEWNYAAAGGLEQRVYPWSNPPSAGVITVEHATYDCLGDGNPDPFDCTLQDILRVGSRPKGDAKWGQSDLGGNLWEWVMDSYMEYPKDCDNCVNTADSVYRTIRGGSWYYSASYLLTFYREDNDWQYVVPRGGGRCARSL